MKTIYSFLIAVLFYTTASAQMIIAPQDTTKMLNWSKATAEKNIKESSYIIEVTAIKKSESFFVKGKGDFTSNIVQINKIFRGKDLKLGTIEILTYGEGGANMGNGYYSMETREMDGMPFIRLRIGQPVLLFCIPSDTSIKAIPDSTVLNINTDNTIRLQPIDWHITAGTLLPKTDGGIKWMALTFKNRKELYNFLSKHNNITIPKEPIEKKSPVEMQEKTKPKTNNADTTGKIERVEFPTISCYSLGINYKENLKNYEQNFLNLQAKLENTKAAGSDNNLSVACKELFISEFEDGSLQNKAVEIFNPTSAAINLNDYALHVFYNGANTPIIIPLSGTILSKKTFVVANPNSSAAVLAKADMTNANLNYNGDDAVALHKISTTANLDIVGEIGVNPGNAGWFVSPNGSTTNHTLLRKQNINQGETVWAASQFQWLTLPANYMQNLKLHQSTPCSVVNDITFAFANPTTTGTTPKYFEFDIMASANNSSTYFDGALFRIDYNTSAFGSSVVANGKSTITKGATFNSITYTDPNADQIDQTSSQMGVPFNTDFNQTSWNRTLVTTSPVQLLHFKIQIQNCGFPANIDFGDQSLTQMFSWYALTATANITNTYNYDNTFYQNPLNNILCQISIISFNSPINAGVGDILTITGTEFGTTRGNGQVKFKNADDGGATYIQKLNSIDYLSWTDTQIQIKVPSIIDSLGNAPVPGSGKIRIVTNAGDSIDSGTDLKIYYGIDNSIPITGPFQKLRVNLMSTDANGGYTIHLNPNISSNAGAKGCIIKALHDWTCYTTINWHLGADTSIASSTQDGVSVLYFGNNPALATTTPRAVFCSSANTAVLIESDTKFDQTTNWFFDTTGAAVPAGQFDFYAVALHELGHFHLLTHVNDINEVLYYSSNPGPISAANRLVLMPSTAATDGGVDVVQNSLTINVTSCGNTTMIPQNVTNCTNAVDELNWSYSINVFPNPSGGTFTIQSSKRISAVEIINMLGEKIYAEQINSAQSDIDLNNKPQGMYLIKLISEKGTATKKIIIQ